MLYVALPYLESLELGWTSLENTVAYVQQYARSLTVLKVERQRLLFRDVELLLNVLTKHGASEPRSLTIEPYFLNPELLDLLAIKLPFLDQLYMKFEYIIPSKHDSPIATQSFCSEMCDRSYSESEWKLRYFVGCHMGPVLLRKTTLPDCESALRVAIQNLDTIFLHSLPDSFPSS